MKSTRWWIAVSVLAAISNAALAEKSRSSDDAETQRVIVKFRIAPGAQAQAGAARTLAARVADLSARRAVPLQLARSVSEHTHALWLERPLRSAELGALLQRLAADPAVEYAVADGRKYRAAVPNDPLFGQTPVTG